MGIVNCTPDSFYAGSRGGLDHALRLIDEGADWIDIGGQSTRPGSDPVSEEEELRRVVPVVEELAKRGATISIDTDKPRVASRARDAGARILNDILGLRAPGMAEAAVGFEKVVVMHMGGDSPKTMQQDPRYADVVLEVIEFFERQRAAFGRAGGDPDRCLIDPGIGFGKTLQHNLALLKHAARLAARAPLVVGASRKSFIGKISPDAGPEARLEGSLAAAVWAAASGASVLRVHDVGATRRALEVASAIQEAP